MQLYAVHLLVISIEYYDARNNEHKIHTLIISANSFPLTGTTEKKRRRRILCFVDLHLCIIF